MTVADIKMQQQRRLSNLMTACGVFFAYSDKQFEDNKTPLEDGDKYTRIPAGGFVPQSKGKALLEGMEEIGKWFDETIEANGQREAHILYELENHEAFYTGSLSATLDELGEGYTMKEVKAVYHATLQRQSEVRGLER